MKKTLQNLVTGLLVMVSITLFSQAPQKFSYQTVIRNSSNQLLSNQQIGIKISVLQGSESGIVVYSERHTPSTNANGLATLSIGTGSVLSGNFQNINWASGSYYIQTETDPNGGNNYTITSTQQLLSVPYALYAETSGSSTPGPQGPTGPQGPAGPQGPQGPAGNPATDNQNLTVSLTGDTLYLQSGGFVIIPGISGANNDGPHSCGATNVHNPVKTYGSMTDQQGNVYKTIVIGTQEWMAENLKTNKYRNGDPIPNVTDLSLWNGLTTGAWEHFNNDSQYECPNGKFYNWYAVADPRHVCPTGWHEPTDSEWSLLINYLDPTADGGNNLPNTAGGKMKTTGNLYWNSINSQATNESGFSGLASGVIGFSFIGYGLMGDYGEWWSYTEFDSANAWKRELYYNDGNVSRGNIEKSVGISVRCIKD
jgi:uncharacterized protein (TIGR02145 family)